MKNNTMGPEIYWDLARIETDWLNMINEILAEDPENEYMLVLKKEKQELITMYIDIAKQYEQELKSA